MRFESRNTIWIVPLALFLTAPFWYGAAARFLAPTDSLATDASAHAETNFTMEGVVFSQFREGRKEWQANSRRLYTGEDENDFLMEDVQAVFFTADRAGKPRQVDIVGDQAQYNDVSKILTLTGDVVVRNSDGYEMQTQVLRYFDSSRQLKADTGVLVTGKEFEVKGRTLEYDLKSGNYRVGGRLQGRFK